MPSRTSEIDTKAVADALHSAAIHLLRGVRKQDEQTGVGPAQLSALSVLVFAGALRLTELARVEQVKAPTMSKVVGILEGRGLVRRYADRDDARAVRLEATHKGRQLLQRGRQMRVERIANALGRATTEEIEVLATAASIIERISRDL
jgi:DNA-binding MarR family transcriptional regulator